MSWDGRRLVVGAAVALATAVAGIFAAGAPAGLTGIVYLYENDPIAIPNGQGAAKMSFPGPQVANSGGVSVGLRVRHERTQQLEVLVKGPNGSVVELSRRDTRGENLGTGPCRDNEPTSASYTHFRDISSDDISAASAPYVGTYTPREPLAVFTSPIPAGSWKLIVKDTRGGADGKLMCGLIRIPYNPN